MTRLSSLEGPMGFCRKAGTFRLTRYNSSVMTSRRLGQAPVPFPPWTLSRPSRRGKAHGSGRLVDGMNMPAVASPEGRGEEATAAALHPALATDGEVLVLPVRDRLPAVAPDLLRNDTELMVVDGYTHAAVRQE